MVNRINEMNKGFNSSFRIGSRVWHVTREEGRRTYRLKCCEYNNKSLVNSLKILSDKNYMKLVCVLSFFAFRLF